MRRTSWRSVLIACALGLAVAPPSARQAPSPVAHRRLSDADQRIFDAFEQKVAKYAELHERLEARLPKLTDEATPQEIEEHQARMERLIRAERPSARQGEFFTPETRALFRRLIAAALGPGGSERLLDQIREDEATGVLLRVNGSYGSTALATVPPDISRVLPRLPADVLEYRFVERHLLLRDVHANLIVDYMRDALSIR